MPNLVDVIFRPQTNSFRINLSYGYMLENRHTGEQRYFHSSMNNAAVLDRPYFVRSEQDFTRFMEETTQDDALRQAQRPNSEWTVTRVCNVTYYVFHIIAHPIGFPPVTLPQHLKFNPGLHGLVNNKKTGKAYTDRLCFFRCLALYQGAKIEALEGATKTLFGQAYPDRLCTLFPGVTLDQLDKLAKKFRVNIVVYSLEVDQVNIFDYLNI